MKRSIPIAYFITPHGFGHAARAAAVIDEISKTHPDTFFEIFTTVPEWFFQQSLTAQFTYHSLVTDVGMVQRSALVEDLEASLLLLDSFYPIAEEKLKKISTLLRESEVQLVLCDIAPLGILAAKVAGIPSVLIENFTWDWIYEGYEQYDSRFLHIAKELSAIFELANFHIQTTPVCAPKKGAYVSSPVSRKIRTPRAVIRKKLGVNEQTKLVLITMGGVKKDSILAHELPDHPQMSFLLPGGSQTLKIDQNRILLPYSSEFFHPDLVNASDAVIGKVGYSTLAEVFAAGVPFGYILRERFPESEVLARFINAKMQGITFREDELTNVDRISALLQLPRVNHQSADGAIEITRSITDLLQ